MTKAATERTSKKSKEGREASPSQLIDARIKELADWRGETLASVRRLIKQADPEAVEEWKWGGVPVWSHAGILCTGETYKTVVKMTFAKGAALDDPSRLFNSSLTAIPGAPSISMRAIRSTKTRWRRSFAPPWRSTPRRVPPFAPSALKREGWTNEQTRDRNALRCSRTRDAPSSGKDLARAH